jgi:hypothetical protein
MTCVVVTDGAVAAGDRRTLRHLNSSRCEQFSFTIDQRSSALVKHHQAVARCALSTPAVMLDGQSVRNKRSCQSPRARRSTAQCPLSHVVGATQRAVSIFGVASRVEKPAVLVSAQHRRRNIGPQGYLNPSNAGVVCQRATSTAICTTSAHMYGAIVGVFTSLGTATPSAVAVPSGTASTQLVTTRRLAAGKQVAAGSLDAQRAGLSAYRARRVRFISRHATQHIGVSNVNCLRCEASW